MAAVTCSPFILEFSDISFETAAAALASDPGFACIASRHTQAADGRYSVIASHPSHTFSFAGGFVTTDGHTAIDSPSAALARFAHRVERLSCDPYLPATAAIGYIGFEGAKAMRGFDPAKGFSRFPQCRFGIYTTAVVFDRVEGTSWIQSADESYVKSRRGAYLLLERLENSTPWIADRGFGRQGPDAREALRFNPDDKKFHGLISIANAWLRAEKLSRIHLARHASRAASGSHPIDAFLADKSGLTRAMFTQEGAAFIFSSDDLLLDIADDRVFSRYTCAADQIPDEHIDEMKRICTGQSLKVCGTTSAGRRRQGMHPLDALAGLIPSHSMTGTPCHQAMNFITENEDTHRSFYGGAFGAFDARRLNFRTIQRSTAYGDGIETFTTGTDITPEVDVATISRHMNIMLNRMSTPI